MQQIKIWTLATRPKTLIASISPVAIGAALSLSQGVFDPLLFLFTLLTAMGIQIGTNLCNDYFDFLKGADTSERKGPLRLTQAGLVSPQVMKGAFILTFSLTFAMGSYLIWVGGAPLALLLCLSIACGVLYTAGPYPLAYLGLGELFVFVFFGPVATAGTYYLQTHTFSWESFLVGIGPGALSTAILSVANVRDIEEDRKAHKKTLAVRLGKKFGQIEYLLMFPLSLVPAILFCSSHPFCLLTFFILLPAIFLFRAVLTYQDPRLLNQVLANTGKLTWLYTFLFCIGWML